MLRVARLHKGRNHSWRQQSHHTYQGRLPLKDPNYGQVASSSHLPVHNHKTPALSSYLEKSFHLPHANTLFVHPKSGLPLLSGRLSYWIAKAISTFDSSNRGTAHDCRKFGHSLVFTRGVLPKNRSFSWLLDNNQRVHPQISHLCERTRHSMYSWKIRGIVFY